jgi:hypothetical protein
LIHVFFALHCFIYQICYKSHHWNTTLQVRFFGYKFSDPPAVVCNIITDNVNGRLFGVTVMEISQTGFRYNKAYTQGGDNIVYGSTSERFSWIALLVQ